MTIYELLRISCLACEWSRNEAGHCFEVSLALSNIRLLVGLGVLMHSVHRIQIVRAVVHTGLRIEGFHSISVHEIEGGGLRHRRQTRLDAGSTTLPEVN